MSKYIELRDAVIAAINAGSVPLLESKPGAGKTAFTNWLGKYLGRPVVTTVASHHDPTDFGGHIINVNGEIRRVPDSFYRHLVPGAIWFLDEIGDATPATRSPLLRAVNERHIGDFALDPSVSIIMAMNNPEYSNNGFELGAPMANRVDHYIFEVDAREWAEQFVDYWGAPPTFHYLREEAWRPKRALTSGYIFSNTSVLHQMPDEKKADMRNKAWPSPRTWERASRILATAPSDEIAKKGVMATIGEGAAISFFNYLENMDLQDPEEIIKDPSKFRAPERGDLLFATLASVINNIKSKNSVDRWNNGWKVLAITIKKFREPDVAAVFARQLSPIKPNGATIPNEILEFKALVDAAGIKLKAA